MVCYYEKVKRFQCGRIFGKDTIDLEREHTEIEAMLKFIDSQSGVTSGTTKKVKKQ
jgi:hypothetical protein